MIRKEKRVMNKPPSESELKFNEVLITRLKIFSEKNRDYGTSYDVDGVIGVVIRLGDKLKRLKTVSNNGFQLNIKEEGLKELFLDIGNYCDIGIMLLGDADEEADCGCACKCGGSGVIKLGE
jgi:hypothetical protein